MSVRFQSNWRSRLLLSSNQIDSRCAVPPASEAYQLLKDVANKGVEVGPAAYDHVIRTFLSEGSMKDAMAVEKL